MDNALLAASAPSQKDEKAPRPTEETYQQFQLLYELANRVLFAGELPQCLITFQRRNGTYGFTAARRFERFDGQITDEIALNPSHFRDRPQGEVVATLVHEMVHVWQHHCGHPGRGRYHNREWAEKMKAVGLQPSDSGEDGGKETGDRMSHTVMAGGPFDRLAAQLEARGFVITWTQRASPQADAGAPGPEQLQKRKENKGGKRVKYTCPTCALAAWSRHGATLSCGTDNLPMLPGQ